MTSNLHKLKEIFITCIISFSLLKPMDCEGKTLLHPLDRRS